MTELSLHLQKTIHASIEKVFDAWLDPKTLSRFILPAPGMASPEVENDPREGGRFSIVMQVGDDKIPHSGTYLTLSRPDLLVFSWESPFSSDDSRVTLKFTAENADTTRVELSHVKFPDEESRSNHEGGWSNILEKLAQIF